MNPGCSLRSGDLVFVSTPSFLYRRVARATGSRASHVGIVFRDPQRGWVVAESGVPRVRYRPLDRFLARSDQNWFVVRRLDRELSADEVEKLRAACDARLGRWPKNLWGTGFSFDSARTFCSKFVHEVYREALGIDIGTVETFSELLHRNPEEKLGFWKWWFFGRIPWSRRTITPAGQMNSPALRTVAQSGSPAVNQRGNLVT
jgi:hypothetical protein